jgi:uncharacterized membrane protein
MRQLNGNERPSKGNLVMDDLLARLGLIGAALYLLWAGAVIYYNPELRWRPHLLLFLFGLYLLAFALCWLSATDERPQRLQKLVLFSLIAAILSLYHAHTYTFKQAHLATDAFLFSDYAAHLLRHGENPYTWDMAAAFTTHRVSTVHSTPLVDGNVVSRLGYPPLHFLLLVPLHLAGIVNAHLLYVLAWIGCFFLLYARAPTSLKGIILFPLLINRDYTDMAISSVTESVWVFLLLCMIATWRRPVWRAIFFGLACAYKQQPWLLFPFLLLRFWLDKDDPDSLPAGQRIVRFVAISGGIFLAINMPFMFADTRSWAGGILSPLFNDEFYNGPGLSAMTQFGWLYLPKSYYLLITAIVFVALIGLYGLNFYHNKEVMWFLPGLAMWFSFQSIQNYFIYALPLLLMVYFNRDLQPLSNYSRPALVERVHPGTVPIMVAVLLILTVATWHFSDTVTHLNVELLDANGNHVHQINQLEIAVANTDQKQVTPNFAVAANFSQPYPWRIVDGPEAVAPGASAVYRITTDIPYRMINGANGAQLWVTDAGGDYTVVGMMRMPPDFSLTGLAPIFNNQYLNLLPAPQGWYWQHEPTEPATLRRIQVDPSFVAVELGLPITENNRAWEYVTLSQEISFPMEALEVWIHPPVFVAMAQAQTVAYGLEIDDSSRRLWFLFGDEPGSGFLSDDHYYESRAAPIGSWSRQYIDLVSLYAEHEWPLPPLERVIDGHIELFTRRITVRLLLAARNQQKASTLTAQFGPLTVGTSADAASRRTSMTVAQQAEYLVIIGDMARRQRNYENAIEAYHRAIALDPSVNDATLQAAIYTSMGWTVLQQDGCHRALPHFRQALALGSAVTDAQQGIALCSR